MNIGLLKRPKLPTILTTMYVCGVLITACTIYMLPYDLFSGPLLPTYKIIGTTFLIGLVALFYTARSKEQTVVYLERRKEQEVQTAHTGSEGESVLNEETIESIVKSGNNVPQLVLNELCNRLGAGQGAIYTCIDDSIDLKYGYALTNEKHSVSYKTGEGLVGRVVLEGKSLYLDDIPEGYITVFSGLGNSSPSVLALIPVKEDDRVKGVIELATFTAINAATLRHLETVAGSISGKLN